MKKSIRSAAYMLVLAGLLITTNGSKIQRQIKSLSFAQQSSTATDSGTLSSTVTGTGASADTATFGVTGATSIEDFYPTGATAGLTSWLPDASEPTSSTSTATGYAVMSTPTTSDAIGSSGMEYTNSADWPTGGSYTGATTEPSSSIVATPITNTFYE